MVWKGETGKEKRRKEKRRGGTRGGREGIKLVRREASVVRLKA